MTNLILKLALYFGLVAAIYFPTGTFYPQLLLIAAVFYMPLRLGFSVPVGIIGRVIFAVVSFVLIMTFAVDRSWVLIASVVFCILDILYSVVKIVLTRRKERLLEQDA